jgi:hypothetical protein
MSIIIYLSDTMTDVKQDEDGKRFHKINREEHGKVIECQPVSEELPPHHTDSL